MRPGWRFRPPWPKDCLDDWDGRRVFVSLLPFSAAYFARFCSVLMLSAGTVLLVQMFPSITSFWGIQDSPDTSNLNMDQSFSPKDQQKQKHLPPPLGRASWKLPCFSSDTTLSMLSSFRSYAGAGQRPPFFDCNNSSIPSAFVFFFSLFLLCFILLFGWRLTEGRAAGGSWR